MGRFIQYYRENAKYLERTHGFVERLGMAKIRAVVVEDSEGIAERLDRKSPNPGPLIRIRGRKWSGPEPLISLRLFFL